MHAHAPPSGGWGSGPARAPADRACPPAPPAPECARPCSRAAMPPAGSEPLCSRNGRWPRRRSPGGSHSGSSRPCVPRDIGRVGEDSGIDHNTNWLRFPYDFYIFAIPLSDLHPHPASPSQPTQAVAHSMYALVGVEPPPVSPACGVRARRRLPTAVPGAGWRACLRVAPAGVVAVIGGDGRGGHGRTRAAQQDVDAWAERVVVEYRAGCTERDTAVREHSRPENLYSSIN
jgi:hypothetical protein